MELFYAEGDQTVRYLQEHGKHVFLDLKLHDIETLILDEADEMLNMGFLEDIEAGKIYMKVYRQMKMYNDPSTNPVLYQNKK